MRYRLHDLSPEQFEQLVVAICQELLGAGVQEFSTGPDGGRDAKFVGRAEVFPSTVDPYTGITIVQAKHTLEAVAKFSDTGFSSDAKSSTLSEELPRIKTLRAENKLDNYMLFANRSLGAEINESIVERICAEAGVGKVHLFGVKAIERLVKRYPHLGAELAEFEYALPLRASPDDLAAVITAIAKHQSEVPWPESKSANSLNRVKFVKKNTLNGLSEDYAKMITKGYLKDFDPLEKFLADPTNGVAYGYYRDAVDEFSGKLIAYRSDFENYDRLLDHLLNMLIARDGDLSRYKRLTRVVFYYMYWSCDIGTEEADDAASH